MEIKPPFSETFADGLIVIISGFGLILDPPAFVACLLLASFGAVVGRGFTPIAIGRRAFGLTLGGGLLFALILLLGFQATYLAGWTPYISPQLLAIIGGLLGPLALPFIMTRFPNFADRLLGRYIPEGKKNG